MELLRTRLPILPLLLSLLAIPPPAKAADDARRVELTSATFVYPISAFRQKRARAQGIELEPTVEAAIPLNGHLYGAERAGRHPALVLQHTCAGVGEHEQGWARRLAEWGYVVLLVDSFTPRGVDYVCDGGPGTVPPNLRALDAYGGAKYLAGLASVDAARIGLLGWSHGGMSVLRALEPATIAGVDAPMFRAAAAFYPLCGPQETPTLPLLILVGDADTWTPAALCVEFVASLAEPHPVEISVFAGATHLFDLPGVDTEELGYRLRYDPAAAAEAGRLLRGFLAGHLDPGGGQ